MFFYLQAYVKNASNTQVIVNIHVVIKKTMIHKIPPLTANYGHPTTTVQLPYNGQRPWRYLPIFLFSWQHLVDQWRLSYNFCEVKCLPDSVYYYPLFCLHFKYMLIPLLLTGLSRYIFQIRYYSMLNTSIRWPR